MLVEVLGTAAGGGIPQWNCACAGCAGARADPGRRRRHASLAVSTGDGGWYVVNATPDLGDQIEACASLHPGPGPRETPLRGVILTDAELDHTLGLARLREASGFEMIATPAVRDALDTGYLRPYTSITWTDLPQDRALHLGGVELRGLRVSGKRPRYAADRDETGAWVVALHITDRADGTALVYAPALAAWPPEFDSLVRGAACVLVDGTFWDDEEPRRTGISERTSTAMGHLPVEDTASRLAELPGRCLYTHLNNTNPLVDPAAKEHEILAGMGIEVARDGMVIDL